MFSQAIDGKILTANPGDRISDKPQTIEEKAKQVAVDRYDITGDHIQIPTYFVVEYGDGEKEALHHVKDAEKISDIVRQMQLISQDESKQLKEEHHQGEVSHSFGLIALIVVAFLLMTGTMLVGIF